jgi:aerobic carbon-monoxide dehydrogenase large subunit
MGQFGIGQPVRRKEDVRLLTGGGLFTDDLHFEGELFAFFLRSPHAHAIIRSLDAAAALSAPGVRFVFTQEDLAADAVGDLFTDVRFTNRAGEPMRRTNRPILASGRARFVGEPIVLVLADSLEQARAAADLVAVDWDELPAVASATKALEPEAPVIWSEFGGNLAVHWENRAPDEIDALLAAAAKTVSIDIVNNRLIPNPMEPRAAVATYDVAQDRITLYAPTQGVRGVQSGVAKKLGLGLDHVRVVSPDTGGGFGIRGKLYPELVAVAWASRKVKRPIKWRSTRSETFLSDYHGRDQVNHATLGLDVEGRIVALKVETILNLGAYMSENGPRMPIDGGGRIIPCGYDIEKFYLSVKAVYTNTVSTDTYRGAGRPEANFLMERLMDFAAEACGLGRDEIRRRNFIPSAKMPYRTQMGLVVDSGDFVGNLDIALRGSDWAGFPVRRGESESRGKRRGIGIGSFLEQSGGRPIEEMRVKVDADGRATVYAGTFSHGQGHETVYSQMVSDYLNVPFEDVCFVQGDTDEIPEKAVGTFGSRSSMMGGVGVKRACAQILEKSGRIAAHLLQSDPAAVKFVDGRFSAGAASVSFSEVARAAADPKRLPDSLGPGLDESFVYERDPDLFNFPNGCHICEVEIDPELGAVEIVRYTAVDDCGTVLNPIIVHGQVYGGVAQGIGQALVENVVYEEGSAQFLSGSFMDYGMPHAHHLAHIEALFNEVPCKTNELGVKGAGEAGACAAPSAFVGAVVDALRSYGVSHVDMPLTPEKIWRAVAGEAA